MSAASLRACYEQAEPADGPAPLPLRRQPPPAAPYPLHALGPVLETAARAIMDRVQCPDAMAAQSVLGAAALAVQPLADVLHPATGRARPLSLFLVTVAASGHRKSAADAEALCPVRKREAAMRESYNLALPRFHRDKEAWVSARGHSLRLAKGDLGAARRALDSLGPEPLPPLQPILTVTEPTLSGLHKLYAEGEPALGLFSDEGGGFLGGHGMNDDNWLRMATGLSELWDGSPIKRVRSGDGSSVMPGRKLSSHLMVQPVISDRLFGNAELSSQGLPGRMLVASPASLVGTRFQRETAAETQAALDAYTAHLLAILERPKPFASGPRDGLKPPALELDREALAVWREFADKVERRLGPGGELEPVQAFGGKLAEHALRLAGVLEIVANPDARSIGGEAMIAATELAQFYAGEALRLFDAGSVAAPVRSAEALLNWLHGRWGRATVGLSTIYQGGPNQLRSAAPARAAMTTLEEHGWATAIKGGATIDGKHHREAWSILAGPERL